MRPRSTNHTFGSGPALLLIPLLAMVLGVLVARSSSPGHRGERPTAPPERGTESATIWTGSLDLADGEGLIVAELAALHLDAERQAQDGRVLGRTFDLPAGQPWRLRVSLNHTAPIEFDPRGLRLVSEGNLQLKPLVSAGEAADHPLLPLLEPAFRSLGSVPTDVILWGPEPGATVELNGLQDAGAVQMSRTDGIPWERLGELGLRRTGGQL